MRKMRKKKERKEHKNREKRVRREKSLEQMRTGEKNVVKRRLKISLVCS
jgi:hypothetical protein